ncbi:hypothetical protein THAOC_03192 [Thalassiosira oceanica]|uniref:Uncharacterized protein n=1 Tax=Thalassiosira oceanica TaxID=159749 RepID=K0TL86_THAOC|nr:hypothetical protein THAOC_03192 [Thalassiosira oceanica]|eukprot:EJK75096.1 hypothetical protein THAOC_03192 [Thalassiosira oceanica]
MKLAIALTLAASANAFAPTNMAGNVSRKNVKNVGSRNCTDRPRKWHGTRHFRVSRTRRSFASSGQSDGPSTSLIIDGRSVQFCGEETAFH